MNPRNSVKQALANLSGKPVNDISMSRLAPMFASQVIRRREADLQVERDAEDFVHPSFVDALRAKAAKLLETEAENTVSGLPVSSIYDALQITKRHKCAKTDAGIRALNGMLTTMWKASREGDIDAEAFMTYRDYFGTNFPKSAVADVFDEIGAQGYAALPVSDLLVIASRIYSQADYDYEITGAGLTSRQPHHVKARRFILAVINGETDHLFDEEEPQADYGRDVADWMIQREQDAADGGDPEDFRRKKPTPKRAQIMIHDQGLDAFTESYLDACLWTEMDDNDVPLENNYDLNSFAPEALTQAIKECEAFEVENADAIEESGLSRYLAGYTFWLTRNGHGAGFWDLDLGDAGDELTDASEKAGVADAYVGDDGQIYFA